MDTIGNNIRLTLFGASHAPEVGFVLTGVPAGTRLDMDAIRFDLERRSAKNHAFATPRHEADDFTVHSGIQGGVTDGLPIRVTFPNRAHDRSEYKPVARPSHADLCAFLRSGGREDISGGGKYSGRMTLPLTFAGSICRGILRTRGIEIASHVSFMGGVHDADLDPMMEKAPKLDPFFPLVDPSVRDEMERLLEKARAEGDTLACGAECAVTGLPTGLGEPLFDGLEGVLSKYLFMIPGLRAVEFGNILAFGSEMNDQFTDGGRTLTNNSGGVNGGMANGMPLIFRCKFRPVPSIAKPQTGYDLIGEKPVPLIIAGRHDTCILPRGLAAVEAAAALALLDLLLENDARREGPGLDGLRRGLDRVDAELMRLFAERTELSKRIGEEKRIAGRAIEDAAREKEVIATRTAHLPRTLTAAGEGLMRLLMDESKRTQRAGMNLYLIGMPDCGKTRTGRKLKTLLRLPLADTDKLIMERTGLSIDEIFARLGEGAFREMETTALRSIIAHGGLIVATGGGLPVSGDNAALMKNSGFTVFLDRRLEALHGQDTVNRPLLSADSRAETDARIDRLYAERHEKYAACADLMLDPDADGAAERIAQAYMRFIETGDRP